MAERQCMLKQAVILAGGKGTRLGARTLRTPKPLLEIHGKPFVAHLIENLAKQSIKEILLLSGPFIDTFKKALGKGAAFGVDIEFISEPEPAGTGGALYYAHERLSDCFLMMNGDSYFDIDYRALCAFTAPQSIARLALCQADDVSRYGAITLADGRVISFGEKAAPGPGIINAGVYWFSKSILDYVSEPPCSLENEVMPVLAKLGLLEGHIFDAPFLDIGTPEDFARAESFMQSV